MNRRLCTILLLFTLLIIPLFSHAAYVPQIKILVVPGHDNDVYGAEFGTLKEADMNLTLATDLIADLQKDKRFLVFTTRDQNGYVKEFADYFIDKKDAITEFKNTAKKILQTKKESGDFKKTDSVPHNPVNPNTSVILYGINKWANENEMDAVIHVHFNDYRRSNMRRAGKYQGFTVYMPEKQMANATESDALAKNIFTELHKDYGTSDFPPEKGGLMSDQTLIALGSNGTLEKSMRSVLIEYGYIYRFTDSKKRPATFQNMADLTAVGITNYFFPASHKATQDKP